MIFVIILTVSTAAEGLIQPYWINTDDVVLSISYTGSSAVCKVSIFGANGTTKITNCNVYLKDSNGSTVAGWTGYSETGDTLLFQETANGVSKGNSYTLSYSAKVYRNGTSEIISGSTTKKYS